MGILSGLAGPLAMGAGYALGGPAGGALMAGGLGYLGQLQTNQTNQDIASSNSAFNAQQAQLNRDFQDQQAARQMQFQYESSANSYQRAVKDLEYAGLNPMLAYMQGGAPTLSGASGGGSSAQAANVQVQNPVTAAVDSYSSVSSAGQAHANVGVIQANTDKIREEIKNIPETGKQIRQTVQLLADQAALAAQKGETEVSIRKMQAATIENLKKDGTLKQLDISAAESLDNLGRESRQLKPIVDMLRMILK